MEGLLYRYLVRRTSGAEDREVYAWLEASEKNRSLFFEVAAVWSAHRTLISPATGERCDAMLRRLNARIDADDAMQRPARFAWRRWMSAAAAAAVVVIAVAAAWLAGLRLPEAGRFQSYANHTGDVAVLHLEDGTQVWLQDGTELRYAVGKGDGERIVRLDGEAYFEVEHDRRAPFVVSTNGLDIEVLGTRFNIRNDDNEHRVTTVLLEGAVKAYASGREQASVRLHPAQQLVFDTRTHAMRLTDCPSAERSINWIDGRFCFEHDTFGEIVAELKRYYNVDIRFMDNRLRDMRFSGNFRVEDGIYHIMSVLQLTYKFNYRIAGNDIELYANPER